MGDKSLSEAIKSAVAAISISAAVIVAIIITRNINCLWGLILILATL